VTVTPSDLPGRHRPATRSGPGTTRSA